MRINPCHGCPLRNGCEQREVFRRKAKRTGARSISFSCPILSRAVSVGARIVINAKRPDDGEYGMELVNVAVEATITHVAANHTFACTIDRGQGIEDQYRFRKFQKHIRIVEFLDQPRGLVCQSGNVRNAEGVCDGKNGACWCKDAFGALAKTRETA